MSMVSTVCPIFSFSRDSGQIDRSIDPVASVRPRCDERSASLARNLRGDRRVHLRRAHGMQRDRANFIPDERTRRPVVRETVDQGRYALRGRRAARRGSQQSDRRFQNR